MGFDLYGRQPTQEVGAYFRNNVWWWRPLWEYVCTECADLFLENAQDVHQAGSYNDGHYITDTEAKSMAVRLTEAINQGRTQKYMEDRQTVLDALPDDPCPVCKGAGWHVKEGELPNKPVQTECARCDGTGKAECWDKHYIFSVENVQEFANFCQESGGFEIW